MNLWLVSGIKSKRVTYVLNSYYHNFEDDEKEIEEKKLVYESPFIFYEINSKGKDELGISDIKL